MEKTVKRNPTRFDYKINTKEDRSFMTRKGDLNNIKFSNLSEVRFTMRYYGTIVYCKGILLITNENQFALAFDVDPDKKEENRLVNKRGFKDNYKSEYISVYERPCYFSCLSTYTSLEITELVNDKIKVRLGLNIAIRRIENKTSISFILVEKKFTKVLLSFDRTDYPECCGSSIISKICLPEANLSIVKKHAKNIWNIFLNEFDFVQFNAITIEESAQEQLFIECFKFKIVDSYRNFRDTGNPLNILSFVHNDFLGMHEDFRDNFDEYEDDDDY